MDTESAIGELTMSTHASPAGSAAGTCVPPHAVASSASIMTATDGIKTRGRSRTIPHVAGRRYGL